LGFEATEDGLALDDLELHALDLVLEEAVECHGGVAVAVEWAKREAGRLGWCLI